MKIEIQPNKILPASNLLMLKEEMASGRRDIGRTARPGGV